MRGILLMIRFSKVRNKVNEIEPFRYDNPFNNGGEILLPLL